MHVVMMGSRGIPATYGGVEKVVEELSVRLVRQGHKVTVLCRSHYTPRIRTHQGVDIVRLPTIRQKHLEMIVHTVLSALYISVRSCDLVHVHSVDPCIVVPFLRLFHPVVATSHGQAYRRDKWGRLFRSLSRLAERIFITAPSKCTAVSRTLSGYYAQRYGRIAEYVPNGVTPGTPAGPEHLEPLGIEKNGYILFVGRLLATKGPSLLIDAYRKARPDLKLVIAGGSSHTDEYEKTLREEAGDSIRFVGYQYGDRLRALYANCRLFVFPSYIEGLPLVLLEALSFGRPVVFSDIPENMEVAEGLGVPFRCGSADDLAEKIQYVLSHVEEMADLQKAAVARLSQEYDWDRVTDQYVQLYRTVTAACGVDFLSV